MNMTPIRKAIEAAGGQSALARLIEVPVAMVWQWSRGLRPVPGKHCIPIEQATRGEVTRHDLRADIFGPALKPEAFDKAGRLRTPKRKAA